LCTCSEYTHCVCALSLPARAKDTCECTHCICVLSLIEYHQRFGTRYKCLQTCTPKLVRARASIYKDLSIRSRVCHVRVCARARPAVGSPQVRPWIRVGEAVFLYSVFVDVQNLDILRARTLTSSSVTYKYCKARAM